MQHHGHRVRLCQCCSAKMWVNMLRTNRFDAGTWADGAAAAAAATPTVGGDVLMDTIQNILFCGALTTRSGH